jgi:MFS transporter, SP family, sugar:H+ symporter
LSSVPLYQAETAPKWIRGAIIGSYQFAITVGLLLAAVVDNATRDRQDTGCYRIPIAIQFAWALILVFGMLLLPETPRYLIRRGQHEAAARSLGRLRRLSPAHPAVGQELDEITISHEQEQAAGKSSTVLDCFRRGMLKRQLTGMALQALQQLTGMHQ